MNRDLTMLLGIEARMKGMEIIHKLDENVQKMTSHFRDAGKVADGMGNDIAKAFQTPEVSAQLLEAANQRVAISTDEVTLAVKNLETATRAAATGDVDARKAQIAAASEYEAALGRLTVASKLQMNAEKANTDAITSNALAQTAAAGGAGEGGLAKLTSYGPKAAILTAVLGGIGIASADTAMKYNELTVKIANSANISQDAAKQISDAFLSMSTRSKFSAEEMSKAYAGVAGQLSTINGKAYSTSDSVKFMSLTSEAAAASGQSLTAVTSSVGKMMQQLKIPTNEAASAITAIYNASRLTGQGVSQVTTRLTMMLGTLGVLAPSVQEASTLMLDFTEHHVNARRASMMLNTVMNTLIKTGHATTPTMGEINDAISKMPKSLQALASGFAHGTISAATYGAEMKKQSAIKPQYGNYLKSLQTLVTQSGMSVQTLNALKITPVQQQLATLGVTVFDKTTKKFVGFKSIIEQIAPKLKAMTNQQDQLRVATILFGGQAKAILPTILAGKDGYEQAANAINDQRAMQEAARRSQDTYESSMKRLHNTVHALQISIGNAFVPIIEKVAAVLSTTLKPLLDFAAQNKTLMSTVLAVAVAFGTFVTAMWAAHKVTGVTKIAFETFGGSIKSLGANARKIISFFVELAGGEELAGTAAITSSGGFWALAAGIWATVWPILAVVAAVAIVALGIYELVKHWSTVWNFIKKMPELVWKAIQAGWEMFWNFLKRAWQDMLAIAKFVFKVLAVILLSPLLPILLLIGAIKFLVTNWHQIWTTIVSVTGEAVKDIGNWLSNAVDFFIKLPGRILSAIVGLAKLLYNWAKDGLDFLVKGLVDGAVAVWHFFTSMPGKIIGFLASLPGKMLDFGVHLIESLIKGIGSMAGKLGDGVKNLVKGIPLIGGMLSSGLSAVTSLFSFHTGGVVPGPAGAEVPAILKAGETVFTADQMKQLANKSRTVTPGSVMARGGGGGHSMTVINVNVSGQVYGSMNELANALGKHLNTRILPNAGVTLKR